MNGISEHGSLMVWVWSWVVVGLGDERADEAHACLHRPGGDEVYGCEDAASAAAQVEDAVKEIGARRNDLWPALVVGGSVAGHGCGR